MLKIRVSVLLILFNFSMNINAQNTTNIQQLVEQKQYSEALTAIDRKLIKNSKNLQLLYLKGLSEAKLNNIKQAIKTYQLITTLYPLSPEAYNNLAGIYAAQGKLELAKETLEKGINTNKSYALIHNNIKNINFEMARASYVKALQLNVKKHDIELDVASLTKSNRSDNAKATVSSPLLANKNRATKEKKSVVPVKAVRRSGKKKIVIKAWDEPVISVKDEVITALQGWAAAWSAQDASLYLSFYNTQFLPDNGTTRGVWAAQRRSRLKKPRWIEVRLSEFNFKQKSENQAEVKVTQLYRSNSFRDRSKKKFLLERSDEGWQIINEINYQE